MARHVILVCGGRKYDDKDFLYNYLDKYHAKHGITLLVHGDCPTGADRLAKRWAKSRGVKSKGYPADWGNLEGRNARMKQGHFGPYDPMAGYTRNQQMLDEHPEIKTVLGFAGENGTADMLTRAHKANKDRDFDNRIRVIEAVPNQPKKTFKGRRR